MPGLQGPVPGQRRFDPAAVRQALGLICEDLNLTGLERFLSRADVTASDWCEQSMEGLLCQCFGVARPAHGDWPVAAITLCAYEKVDPQSFVLRADPVHLRADMRDITLFDARVLDLSQQLADAMCAEINQHFEGEDWHLRAVTPEFWCVYGLPNLDIRTEPLSRMHMTSIDGHLPVGADARLWQRRVNEIQMLLHNSELNLQRQEAGLIPVNGVWLWGGGRLPNSDKTHWRSVHANDDLSRVLAALAVVDYHELAEDGEATLNIIEQTGQHLIVLSDLHEAANTGQVEQWRASLDGIVQQWLAPLMDALAAGRLGSLSLATGDGRVFCTNRRGLFRWWRRTRRFPVLMTGTL